MQEAARIAFYAPLKPPDHPIPSGDRQMARMLLAALARTGHDAFLASRVIAYSKRPGLEHLAARKSAALAEADRLLAEWANQGGRPDLWFSYHPYDKSPDWLGEAVCSRLSIPMVTAEPCRTGADGEWLPWRAESSRIIAGAAMNIVFTDSDRKFLSTFVPDEKVVWLDPFVDSALLQQDPFEGDPWNAGPGTLRLLVVGMMRPGAKLESYALLASALKDLVGLDWSLLAVGEGPGEAEVRGNFANLPAGRIAFAGVQPPGKVLALMDKADLLVWPGCREAYGMVYLEAASRGLPAVALNNMGVPRVVEHMRTGLLADPPDARHYRDELARAMGDARLRAKLAAGALAFVEGERSGAKAAERLAGILAPVLTRRSRS